MNLLTFVAFSLSDFVSLLQLAYLTSAVAKTWSKLFVIASLYQTVIWTLFFLFLGRVQKMATLLNVESSLLEKIQVGMFVNKIKRVAASETGLIFNFLSIRHSTDFRSTKGCVFDSLSPKLCKIYYVFDNRVFLFLS